MNKRPYWLARLALAAFVFALVFAFTASAFAASTYFDQYPAVGGVCSQPMPRISVKVSDPAGINSGYQIKLDGVSKAVKTKWGPNGSYVELYYQVPSALSNGTHTVYASVFTGAGRTSTTWTFTQSLAPAIGPMSPADGTTVDTQKPAISAVVNTAGGATVSSWSMAVDGAPVAATYDQASKTVSYTPFQRLTNDREHTVELSVTDSTGASASVAWDFRVQIYASMVDTQGCTECHAAYPASHPMTDCWGCHAANGPFSAYWNMDNMQQYAHSSDYLAGIDCAYCHSSQFADVPRHPANIGDAHQTGTDMSGCSCHVADLTIEHNRYQTDAGGDITCATCHDSDDPQVQAGMAKGTKLCADCHTIGGNHPYGDVDHVADVGETADLSGKVCSDCHDMDLMPEHEKATSSSAGNGCTNCHEFAGGTGPADALDGWNQTCSQGGCHAAGSDTAMHTNQAQAHAAPASPTCMGSGCHSFSDVAALHSSASTTTALGTFTSCSVCHRADATLTKDCGTCHPDRLEPHGYEPVDHTASDAASLACAAAGCHDTAEAMPIHSGLGCKTCHGGEGRPNLVEGKTRFACIDCHVTSGVDYHAGMAAKHIAPVADYESCGHCHHGWGSSPIKGPDITRHAACSTCHNATMDLAGKTAHCGDCHQTMGSGPKPEYFHQSIDAVHSPQDPGSLDCARCHETTNVYDLHGADGCANCHATYGCSECHSMHYADPSTPLLRNVSCSRCHTTQGTDYHKDFTTAHTNAAMDSGCQATGCHSNSLVTTHEAFVGTGKRYPQYTDTCALCHLNADPGRIPANATADCSSCHDADHGDLGALHTSETACFGSCHTERLDTTAHVPSCATCHQSAEPRVTQAVANSDTRCAACHRAGSGYVDGDGQVLVAVAARHDGVQPAITNVVFNYASSPAAPTISWTTDRPCTTYVDYTAPDWSYDGENFTGYTATAGSGSFTTTHTVSFPAPSYASSSGYYYHYRIRTVDEQGRVAVTSKRIYHRSRSGNTAAFPYGFEPDCGSLNTDMLRLAVIKPDGSRLATMAVEGWEAQAAEGARPSIASPGTPVSASTLATASATNYGTPTFWRTRLAVSDGDYNWQVARFRLDTAAAASMQGLLVEWLGYAENSDGHPVDVYLWNFDTSQWEKMDSRQSTGDSTYTRLVESASAAQSYCLRCHSTPVSADVNMPSNLSNIRVAWNTDFHGTAKGSGYGGTLKAPYARGQAALDCDACHDPAAHGSTGNPYKLKASVNGSAVSVTDGASAVTLCVACHEGTPNDFHAQCISCHVAFVPNYHNDTGNAPEDFTGADCLSCHKHGKTGYAPGCHSCHNEAGAGPFTTF